MGLQVCNFDGGELIIPEGDWMLQDLVARGEYEPYVIGPFVEAIEPHHTVLDIGANVGVFTVAAARRARRVIAIEAFAENAKLVAANAARNGLTNVEVWPVAVTDHIEMATFNAWGASNKVVRPHGLTMDTLSEVGVCMGLPIDLLISERIDIVKMDVEGREYAALSGAQNLFRQRPLFFIEFSPEFIFDGCGVSSQDFLDLFFGRGYAATILHRDMTREEVGQDSSRLIDAWRSYMDRQITHLDLMFRYREASA